MTGRRVASLDALRGLTIAGMILVNNPGSWAFVYPPLKHAEWHGWTPTDLVFPFFVFIVGASISLAIARRLEEGAGRGKIYGKIFRRSLVLFGLGILLHLIPRLNFATLRIPGVLQRIALCYLFSALLYLHLRPGGRMAVCLAVLWGYWLVMMLVPVPGYGPGVLEKKGNLCAYVDSRLLAGHLYEPGFDPEGILSTFPAVATCLLGTLAGDWIRKPRKPGRTYLGLAAGGFGLTALGLALHPYFPINKQLWTSTFVLFSAGAALLLLAACSLLVDELGWRAWAWPFFAFGTNAIAAYVGSSLVVKLLLRVKVSSGGSTVGILAFAYQRFFVPWAGEMNGSLAYAVTYVLIWLALVSILYKKKIFIKI